MSLVAQWLWFLFKVHTFCVMYSSQCLAQACRSSAHYLQMANSLTYLNGQGIEQDMVWMRCQHWQKRACICGLKTNVDFGAPWMQSKTLCYNLQPWIQSKTLVTIYNWNELTCYFCFVCFFGSSGGAELLMAHGIPMTSWAAAAFGTGVFNSTGISNRQLAVLAGNSMHTISVA